MINMDNSYIAGFFDGEGSAFIIVTRPYKGTNGTFYRFRSYISISQQYPEVLQKIKESLGFGYVAPERRHGKILAYKYRITTFKDAKKFCEAITPFCYIKKEVLQKLAEFINLCMEYQKKWQRRTPYDLKTLKNILKLRLDIHKLNKKTCRKSAKWKVKNEDVLKKHTPINPAKWIKGKAGCS